MDLFQSWRKYDVIKREWVFQLEDNFEKVKDKYVYLRTEGIRKLLYLVRMLNEQEEIAVFLRLQNHKETNVSLHILAFVLQNLPSSYLDQALKPFPRVCLKDDPTPNHTPRNLADSGAGTPNIGTFNSVIINGSAVNTYKDHSESAFNSVVINRSADSINTDTYNSVIINRSTDSIASHNDTYNSVIINKSTDSKFNNDSFNSVIINQSSDNISRNNTFNNTFNSVIINRTESTDSRTNTYNSVIFNDDEHDKSDIFNTVEYHNTLPSNSPSPIHSSSSPIPSNSSSSVSSPIPLSAQTNRPLLLRRSEGGTAVYANVSTTEERAIALELIQGVCLIHGGSKTFLFENGIVSLLILLIETKDDTPLVGVTTGVSPSATRNLAYSHSAPSLGRERKSNEFKKDVQYPRKQELIAAFDAVMCILVDHEPLQKEFVDLRGVEAVVRVLKNPLYGREVRSKCVVLLVYLVRYFPIGHSVKLVLIEIFGDQLVNVLMRSVRLGQPTELSSVPGESFLDAFDKSVESVKS